MDWIEITDKYSQMLEEHLKKYFVQISYETEQYHPFINRVYNSIAEYTLRKDNDTFNDIRSNPIKVKIKNFDLTINFTYINSNILYKMYSLIK
jgi:hypothetical protein